jgi:hypothetical protein
MVHIWFLLYKTWFGGGSARVDAGMLNLLPEVYTDSEGKKQVRAVSRNGITGYQVTSGTALMRGFYVWEKTVGTTYYFAVCGNNMYTSTDGITWANLHAVTAGSGVVRFTEFINDVNTKWLIAVDGTKAYRYVDNATVLTIDTTSDPQFPSPHVPFPVFLDGYLFLAKSNTGDIYNSDLNDPTAWTAGSFISTEVYPDDIQALAKVNNYLLAIGTQSCEYFYDAANATASPLARQEGATLPFGTLMPNSIASNKNTLVFLANTNDGDYSLRMIEDLKYDVIHSKWLANAVNQRLNASAGTPITSSSLRGYFTRANGKLYYNLALQGDSASPDKWSGTFAYSMEDKIWTELGIGTDASSVAPYPVFFSAIPRSGNIATYVGGHLAGTPFAGRVEENSASISDVINNYTGSGNYGTIYWEFRTPFMNFGTLNRKFMNRLGINAPQWENATYKVSYCDAETSSITYTDANTTISGISGGYPFITQLGTFRYRSIRVARNSSTEPALIYNLEFEINKGMN